MNRDILSKIEQEQMISREELEELLTTTDQELIEELYRRASDSREILWKRDLPEGADRIYQLLQK